MRELYNNIKIAALIRVTILGMAKVKVIDANAQKKLQNSLDK